MDMDLGMDIASYSMANAANNLMQSVGVSMLSKTLDSQEMQGDALAKSGCIKQPLFVMIHTILNSFPLIFLLHKQDED